MVGQLQVLSGALRAALQHVKHRWTSCAWHCESQGVVLHAGPIHFVSYSTEEPYGVGSAQYNFIAADLAAVNRTITPWVVASGHRPVSPPLLCGHVKDLPGAEDMLDKKKMLSVV